MIDREKFVYSGSLLRMSQPKENTVPTKVIRTRPQTSEKYSNKTRVDKNLSPESQSRFNRTSGPNAFKRVKTLTAINRDLNQTMRPKSSANLGGTLRNSMNPGTIKAGWMVNY